MVNELNAEPLKWSTYCALGIVIILIIGYFITRWKRKKRLREDALAHTQFSDIKKQNEKKNEELVLTIAFSQAEPHKYIYFLYRRSAKNWITKKK